MRAVDVGAWHRTDISSAMVAAIGNGTAFSKGREFGAWLGLVPGQMSTGDRTIAGKIWNPRQSLSAGAVRAGGLGRAGEREVLGTPRAQILDRSCQERMHHNVLAIALANKLARIAWAVLNKERNFGSTRTNAMEPDLLEHGACSVPSGLGLEAPSRGEVNATARLDGLRAPEINGRPGRRNRLLARTEELDLSYPIS